MMGAKALPAERELFHVTVFSPFLSFFLLCTYFVLTQDNIFLHSTARLSNSDYGGFFFISKELNFPVLLFPSQRRSGREMGRGKGSGRGRGAERENATGKHLLRRLFVWQQTML